MRGNVYRYYEVWHTHGLSWIAACGLSLLLFGFLESGPFLKKGSSHPPPVVQWRRHDADGSSASANLDQLTGNINVKKTGTMSLIQLFTVVRTDTTLDLSQKAEKVSGKKTRTEDPTRRSITTVPPKYPNCRPHSRRGWRCAPGHVRCNSRARRTRVYVYVHGVLVLT